MSKIFDTGGFIGLEKPYSVPAGEAAFTSPGTFSWTAPEGVTSVCVVCVGGGGGGGTNNADASSGGGGGGLGYKNNITVVPGTAYTVVVGSGGAVLAAGGQSYFSSAATVAGNGGSPGVNGSALGAAGGTFVGDGGANGGQGGQSDINDASTDPEAGAGGGAGGYSAAGGRGAGAQAAATTGTASTGGGGGGGGSPNSGAAGGGGGVNIFGAGSNGAGGAAGVRGGGGSGGLGGTSTPIGGLYGGGGAGADSSTSGAGAAGAVRIIWGANRSFPSTNVTENSGNRLYLSGMFSLNSVYDSLSKLHGLTYTYYTQGSTTNPTTEAGLDALFNTATVNPTVTFNATGIYTETISWGDTTSLSGAGGITKTKPAYLRADNYSWMVEGYILAPETGTYTFGVDGDDACDIHVNGVNVANSYGGHGFYSVWSGGVSGANTQKSGTISLSAGQYYTFRARMQDGGGGDGIQVGWRKPSDGAIALIPLYFFYRSI
jgi:hypothetical protein